MRRLFVAALAVILVQPAWADKPIDAVVAAIPHEAFTRQVLMVGESHRQPQSHALALRLIRRALNTRDCVAFALEVPSSGNAIWRNSKKPSDLDSMKIGPVHDSPSLRQLMVQTASMARNHCLSIHAIDQPVQNNDWIKDRDVYMANQLKKLAKSGTLVIALVGNLHALRHLDWDFDHDSKPVSQYLDEAGLSTYVILQDWKEKPAKTEVFKTDSIASLQAINRLGSVASVKPAKSLGRYGDVLAEWGEKH